ncbi:p24 complex component, partial [Physocladia obscura]
MDNYGRVCGDIMFRTYKTVTKLDTLWFRNFVLVDERVLRQMPQFGIVVVFLGLGFQYVAGSNQFGVTVEPSSTQCFHEEVQAGETLRVSFAVDSNEAVDFWVTTPHGSVIEKSYGTTGGAVHTATSASAGRVGFCFSNSARSQSTAKRVSFTAFGPDEIRRIDDKLVDKKLALDPIKDSLRNELNDLTNAIQQVVDEQAYIRSRLVRHHATAE